MTPPRLPGVALPEMNGNGRADIGPAPRAAVRAALAAQAARPAAPAAPSAPREAMGDQLQEIVEYLPGGVLRWGTPLLAGVLAILLVISWLVAYPDVASGRFTLTTATPPARLVARVNGEIERIFVRDGQRVARGAALVAFRSGARYADVAALSGRLDALERALSGGGALPALDPAPELGTLQDEYVELLARLSDFRSLRAEEGVNAAKAGALQDQIRDHERLHATLLDQQALLEEDVRIADRERARLRELAARQLVSAAEVERAEQAYLQKRMAAENGRASASRSLVELSGSRNAALDYERQRAGERRSRELELRSAVQQLRTAVTAWEAEYLVRAPLDGTVSVFRDIHEAQHVSAFDPVVAVLPDSRQLAARVQLEERDAGKVRRGQRVILRFDSYPDREYGTVAGVVRSVSRLGMQGEEDALTYLVEVSLADGLRTSYGRRLGFRQELRGEADIVTADRRLIGRFFDQFRPAPAH